MKTKQFNKIKPYTYLVTRLSDNKKYHGVRWGNKVPPIKDLRVVYFTSSREIRNEFKNNPSNFKIKFCWTFDTVNEARLYETKYNRKIYKNENWINKNAFPAILNKVHPLLGKKPSKETRLKISKGNKGKKASLETKAKLSKMRRGRKLSKTHIENIRKGNIGVKRSLETRQKIRLANLGRKASEETRLKMSEMRKGVPKSEKHKAKLRKNLKKFMWNKGNEPWNKGKKGLQLAWNKGKKFSMETRMRMSLSHKGHVPWNKGKKGAQVAWNKGLKLKKMNERRADV